MQLGHLIKQARLQAGLTQSQLAEKLEGTDRCFISGVENGRIKIGLNRLILIAEALGKRVEINLID